MAGAGYRWLPVGHALAGGPCPGGRFRRAMVALVLPGGHALVPPVAVLPVVVGGGAGGPWRRFRVAMPSLVAGAGFLVVVR